MKPPVKSPINSNDHLNAHPEQAGCAGFCEHCGREHKLEAGPALEPARRLMRRLEEDGRLDFDVPVSEADPRFSTDYLYGRARGQMFGVMVCRTEEGELREIKAFSGQYNSVWHVPGWVPPVVDDVETARISCDTEREIKRLGRVIDGLPGNSEVAVELKQRRAGLSRGLMREIHGLYTLTNFRGSTASLFDAFLGAGAPPSGTGDCCAPKLLNYAALNGCEPLGLAEFYFGRTNRSGTRVHGRFYPACADKCRPILGFMLCGLPVADQP